MVHNPHTFIELDAVDSRETTELGLGRRYCLSRIRDVNLNNLRLSFVWECL